ncbi:hypothetical protein ACFXPV_33735 [Streptomyces sp. NPDC059118]|uniref:hypothetical protein n=1 Tax=unclassified Streptomyces TaxID=2593676 RepID=UPI0036A70BA6
MKRRMAVLLSGACVPLTLGIAGWALAGSAGLLVAGVCSTVSALVLLRWVRVAPLPHPPGPGLPVTPFVNAPYARYRRLVGALSWGRVSARHFDHTVRPHLERITADLLMDRRGIDTRTNPQAARAVLGADLWPLADPDRRRSDDSAASPVPLERVAELVRRLEEL